MLAVALCTQPALALIRMINMKMQPAVGSIRGVMNRQQTAKARIFKISTFNVFNTTVESLQPRLTVQSLQEERTVDSLPWNSVQSIE